MTRRSPPPRPEKARSSRVHAPSRRRVVQGLGATAAAAALGCGEAPLQHGVGGQAGGKPITGAGGGDGGADTTTHGGTTTQTNTGQGGAGGQGGGAPSCTDNGGYSPEQLLAPIETVVVLMMENRSFDHYFGSLSLVQGLPIDGLTGAETNPDPNGDPVGVFQLDDLTVADPPHGWDASHAQWNGGANDGFVIAHAGADEKDVMGYHVEAQLPAAYALAKAYTLCERWFASVMGPTWPNRFYLHGATSKGQKQNLPVAGFDSLFKLLADAGLDHRNYFHDVAWCSGAYFKLDHLDGISKFFDAAASGALPPFSIIDPQFFGAGANDDHPDHDVSLGQALIATVYKALAASPQWGKCLFVITYDEHGGFFDHVPPPTTDDGNTEFQQMGFRVPGIVIGPFVRKGCVVDTVFEHASVAATAVKRWGLTSLNARMSAANDLSPCIDPAYLADPQPPVDIPAVPVSMSKIEARAPRAAARAAHTHPEVWEAAERLRLPPHLDRRSPGLGAALTVLAEGIRLGAVKLLP